MNQLTMVVVYIKNASGTLDLFVREGETGAVLTQILGQPANEGWNSFDITNINVTPGQKYSIYLNASEYGPQWSYKASNTYANGRAYWDSNPDDNKDFGFKTFGISTGGTTPGTTPDSSTGTTGSAPSTNISSSIKTPTNVKAENSPTSTTAQIKVSWTKSATTDITGYKVFRKEEGKDYSQIGLVDKTKTEFLDSTVKDVTKYTYMVRAYKENLESENSNEATVTASKVSKKVYSAPILSNLEEINWTDPIFLAALGGSALAILGFTLWYLISRRKQKEAGIK
jgi:hypothetical protein